MPGNEDSLLELAALVCEKECQHLRFFYAFPTVWGELGLLLLRLTVGLAAMPEGTGLGVVAMVVGAFLVVGFLTPLMSGLVGVVALAMALGWMPEGTRAGWETRPALLLVAANSVAVVLLGPGVFSVDSRLFGRREIIIPRGR